LSNPLRGFDFETLQQALALAPGGEIRAGVLEVGKFRPEQALHEIRAAFLVGVGKGVARWRGDAKTREHA
jgi:hypothetical protein